MEDWIDFYEPFFATRADARKFVSDREGLDASDPKHPAKIMMHQTQRMISLSDDLPTIRPGRESLQLVFLLICAEHIAKLHDNFNGEGHSRAYVRDFFGKFLTAVDKAELEAGMLKYDRTSRTRLSLLEVVDILYDVRCDVVHEGQYWSFNFSDGATSIINSDPDVIVSITLQALSNIIVRGCIKAIESY